MGSTILIVDDEEDVRKLFAGFLKRKGYECLLAGDALSALRFVRKEALDLVLTDYSMPEVNGITLLKEIRQIRPELPVVMISGTADMQTAMHALKEHAFDFLGKPVDSGELLSVIEQALKRPLPDTAGEGPPARELGPILVSATAQPDVQVVHFNRPLDEYSIKAFTQSLAQLTPTFSRRLIFVLRNVSYINSVGLNFLLEFLQRIKASKRQAVLASVSEPVYRYLKLLGYLDHLSVVPTVEAGLEFLRD
ncbi:MAG: response regulator [Spirochaetales bacterium]|nr:response regulator [Spirochaetales bacterium]